MTNKQLAFKAAATTVIKNLEKRGIDGYFCESKSECVTLVESIIPDGSTVSWGGSETIIEAGIMDMLSIKSYQLIDRFDYKTPDEERAKYAQVVQSDYYLMSSNAITLEGELVNIDGRGNRLACLLTGPRYVIMVIGMNKLTANTEAALLRVKNTAAPANVQRLKKDTPCFVSGRCHDCFSKDCICSNTVITRRSQIPGRIKILLVAEDLGY